MTQLPAPKYTVALGEVGRKRQYVIKTDTQEILPKASVTEILSVINKPALLNWYAKMTAENIEAALIAKMDGKTTQAVLLTERWIKETVEAGKKRPKGIAREAADIGTLCHECFRAIVTGNALPKYPPELDETIKGFVDWFKCSKLEVVATELAVGSIQYGYAGTVDALAVKDGNWGILDYKTSSGIYPEMALQVAAYGQAVNEQYGIVPKWFRIARFSKKEPYGSEVKAILNASRALRAFLSALDLKTGLDEELLDAPSYTTFERKAAESDAKKATEKAKKSVEAGARPF